MNSRQRRKLAAREHNDRPALMQELKDLQSSIHTKQGTWVQAVIDNSNDSVRLEIAKLRGILKSDTPPSRPVANRRKVRAGIALAFMAGMGVV